MAKNTSSNSETHPYLLISFWLNPSNQFWNKPGYSKDVYNDALARWCKREKRLTSIEPNK